MNEGHTGTWEVLLPPFRRKPEGTTENNSRPIVPAFEDYRRCFGHVRNRGRRNGIAERRKRSEARRVTRSRSILIVPMKQGNFSLKDPVEGSEMPYHRTVAGKHGGCDGIQNSVNETTTDSRACEGTFH